MIISENSFFMSTRHYYDRSPRYYRTENVSENVGGDWNERYKKIWELEDGKQKDTNR